MFRKYVLCLALVSAGSCRAGHDPFAQLPLDITLYLFIDLAPDKWTALSGLKHYMVSSDQGKKWAYDPGVSERIIRSLGSGFGFQNTGTAYSLDSIGFLDLAYQLGTPGAQQAFRDHVTAQPDRLHLVKGYLMGLNELLDQTPLAFRFLLMAKRDFGTKALAGL